MKIWSKPGMFLLALMMAVLVMAAYEFLTTYRVTLGSVLTYTTPKGSHRRKQRTQAGRVHRTSNDDRDDPAKTFLASSTMTAESDSTFTPRSTYSVKPVVKGRDGVREKNNVHFTPASAPTKHRNSSPAGLQAGDAGKHEEDEDEDEDEDEEEDEDEDEEEEEGGGLGAESSETEVDRLVKLRKLYLLRSFTGRLGNCLFELASAVCIAKLNNLTLVVDKQPFLADLKYRGIALEREEFVQLSRRLEVTVHGERSCCSFSSYLMKMQSPGRNHWVKGHSQSWKYFEPCKRWVKKAIAFNEDIAKRAVTIVRDLRKKYPGSALVGVHVRQEDYLSSRAMKSGKKVAPPDYYLRAMTYFRNRFRDVIFMVISSNQTEFKASVKPGSDAVFLNRSDSAAVDMEVLSRLDHIIMSVGTFGWWAAYRNNGTVVCYRDFFVPGSNYGRQILNNGKDFFYPGWITM